MISPERLRELCRILEADSPMLKRQARQELVLNAGPEIIERLIRLLSQDEAVQTVVCVIEALGKIADRRALIPLLKLESDLRLAESKAERYYEIDYNLPVILSNTIESLSQDFIEQVRPEDIPYILTLLQRARGWHTFLNLAGRAVEKLADTNPTPELADVLPYFEGFWGIPFSFLRIRRKLKKALQSDLPIPAIPPHSSVDLPLPVQSFAKDNDNDG